MFPSGLKILFDGYLTESSFCPKSLCDGYVIETAFLNKLVLKISYLVCDGHVIEPKFKGIILFDAYLTGSPKQTQKQSKTIEQQAHSYLMVI